MVMERRAPITYKVCTSSLIHRYGINHPNMTISHLLTCPSVPNKLIITWKILCDLLLMKNWFITIMNTCNKKLMAKPSSQHSGLPTSTTKNQCDISSIIKIQLRKSIIYGIPTPSFVYIIICSYAPENSKFYANANFYFC